MKQIIILIISVFLVSACASKRYVKKGMELESSGLYKDAANQYYNSLLKNIKNIDAKIALQRTGQLVLDDYIDEFKGNYQNGTPKEAVYSYKKAQDYFNKLKKVGVNPIFPEDQLVYYKEVEDLYLSDLYTKATKALTLEEFSSSESMFSEILSFNKNYKDTKSKWVIAKYEPLYRKGVEFKNTEMYRSAYLAFKNINKANGSYKNSLDLMNQSLELAKVTIEIPRIEATYSSYAPVANQLKGLIINEVNNLKSPLYQVISSGGLRSGYKNRSMAYQYDRTREGLAQPLKVESKAKARISGKVYEVDVIAGKRKRQEKHGFLKREVEYVDEETKEKKTKTVYDKVKYYEYTQVNEVRISVEYSMKRNDTGEVVFTNVFNKSIQDKVHYARYEGDTKKLIPGYWKYSNKGSSEDSVKDSSSEIEKLKTLLKSNSNLKSTSELQNQLLKQLASSVAQKVSEYKPEK